MPIFDPVQAEIEDAQKQELDIPFRLENPALIGYGICKRPTVLPGAR
jgi:hypothetical protein